MGSGLQHKLRKVFLRSRVYIWQLKPTLFKSLNYSIAMPWGKNTLHSQTGICSKMTVSLLSISYWKGTGKFPSPNFKCLNLIPLESPRSPGTSRGVSLHCLHLPALQWTESHSAGIYFSCHQPRSKSWESCFSLGYLRAKQPYTVQQHKALKIGVLSNSWALKTGEREFGFELSKGRETV